MRSRSDRVRLRWVGATVALFFLSLALPASAAERSASDVVLVDSGATITDDLYAAGNRVVILGRIDGDLVATAFEDILVAGRVTGDVLAVGASVEVTGTVEGSVRAFAPTVVIGGEVGGDVVASAWSTSLDGTVQGDAIIWGNQAQVVGSLGGDLEGQTRRLQLGGTTNGTVDITVGRLDVVDGTVVEGDLAYRSKVDASGVDNATVGGAVVHRLPLAPNVRVRALAVMAKVVLGLMAAVTGLMVMWAAPAAAARATKVIEKSWWRAWLRGLAVMAAPLVVVAVAAILIRTTPAEAAVGVVAVFAPFLLAVLGAVATLAFVAPVGAYPWLGRLNQPERSPVRAFLYATLTVVAASLIPWVVWIVALTIVPIGIGGWVGPTPSAGVQAERVSVSLL